MKYIDVMLQSINWLVIPIILVNGLTSAITNQSDDQDGGINHSKEIRYGNQWMDLICNGKKIPNCSTLHIMVEISINFEKYTKINR